MKRRKVPRLEIRINDQIFQTTFGSVEDVLKDDVWKVATDVMHDMVKAYLQKLASLPNKNEGE